MGNPIPALKEGNELKLEEAGPSRRPGKLIFSFIPSTFLPKIGDNDIHQVAAGSLRVGLKF